MKPIVCRLTDGQDLLLEIKKLVHENNVEAAVILSGVGSLKESNIRVPVIDGEVIRINPKNLEIVALQGTVSQYGGHIHIAVSDTTGAAYGGHMQEGCIVRTTCEVVLGVFEGLSFKREMDENTGYDELTVEKL